MSTVASAVIVLYCISNLPLVSENFLAGVNTNCTHEYNSLIIFALYAVIHVHVSEITIKVLSKIAPTRLVLVGSQLFRKPTGISVTT